MTLTANYGLVLPKNYVSINETEMEYVDGGGTHYGYFYGGFITYRISKSVMNAAAGVGATAAATAALAAAGVTGGVSLVVVPGLAGIIGACLSNALLKQDFYYYDIYYKGGATYTALRAASGFDNQITLDM